MRGYTRRASSFGSNICCVKKGFNQYFQIQQFLETTQTAIRVQDPYSFRCIPQVHGAVQESLLNLMNTIAIELNSATDNPLIFPDVMNPGSHEVVSQGNFHAEVLGLVSDAMSLGLFELSSISERRIDQMLDPVGVHFIHSSPTMLAWNQD